MSATRGDIVENTLRALRKTLNSEDRETVEGYCNRFYFDLCGLVPIKALRRRATINLSSGDYSDGMWLPSNMAGILRVFHVDDEYDFIDRDRAGIDYSEYSNRFYTYVPTDGPAHYGDDLFVRQAGTTFTSAGLATDYTGSYVKFGNEPGLYLLTAIKTFTPTYWGPGLSSSEFIIRPTNTEKIVCINGDEDEITDTEIYVDYWQYPVPIYKDNDAFLLPSTRALELMVMKEAMFVIGKRQLSSKTYDRDIQNAMDELQSLCPTTGGSVKAKDVQNKSFTFDQNPFTDR